MKPTLVHPSWHDIEKGASILALQIEKRRHGPPPEWVVGLTRGGLIPAVIISHLLDLPMMPVNYSSKDGRGDNRNHNNSLPMISGDISSGAGVAPSIPSLLIVDDICDSGKTLLEVKEHYLKQQHYVWTAALYFKKTATIVPDFYWQRIWPDSPWIVFPWET